jgi:hypothetical protein
MGATVVAILLCVGGGLKVSFGFLMSQQYGSIENSIHGGLLILLCVLILIGLHRQRANYLLAVLIIYVRLFMKLLNFC